MTQEKTASATTESRLAAFESARAAEDKKAKSTVILDVRQVTLLADYFVFTGGETKNQVKAIAQEVKSRLSALGRTEKSVEGLSEGRWVLMDYGDLIVHILQETERDYYKLEQFWNNALVVDSDEWSNNGEIGVQNR